jgi:hypothetical protein
MRSSKVVEANAMNLSIEEWKSPVGRWWVREAKKLKN